MRGSVNGRVRKGRGLVCLPGALMLLNALCSLFPKFEVPNSKFEIGRWVAPLAVLAFSTGTISRRATIGRAIAREAARLSKSGSLSARTVGNSQVLWVGCKRDIKEGRTIMSSHFIDQCTWDVNTVDYVAGSIPSRRHTKNEGPMNQYPCHPERSEGSSSLAISLP
jgi:hypothetical protein